MKYSAIIVSVFALLLFAAVSCEETLEVCAPCGLLSEGDVSITGDPRLDGTLEAVYLLDKWGSLAAESFDSNMALLAEQYGVEIPEDGRFSAGAVADVVAAINQGLFGISGVEIHVSMERPRCWIDSSVALERQVVCEEGSDLYVPPDCSTGQQGSCTGLCEGECIARVSGSNVNLCTGVCYREAALAGDECLVGCIGSCEHDGGVECPGRCFGQCDTTCAGYTSLGRCNGECEGLCVGVCDSRTPFDCEGECEGLCRVPVSEEGACDGICMGDCAQGKCAGASRCRGHFRPRGCDSSINARQAVLDCQEMTRLLGWANLRCEPAGVRSGIEMSPLATELDRGVIISRASRLESILAAILDDYGKLSLLVEGVDVAQMIGPGELTDEYQLDTRPRPAGRLSMEDLGTWGYVEAREHLPLTGLKARLGMLRIKGTSGDYEITAGSLPCVQPALEEAWSMIDVLIPCTAIDEDGDDVIDSFVENRAGGLYRVWDGMEIVLGLGLQSVDE